MPQKDVFNANIRPTEAWTLDGAVVTIGNGTNLLVSQVSINYARAQTQLKPVNQNKNIMIVGEGAGTISMSVIVGPGDQLKEFLTQYSDPCRLSENTVRITGAVRDDCHTDRDGDTVFVAGDVLSNSLGVSVAGGGPGGIAMINGTINFSIGSLNLE